MAGAARAILKPHICKKRRPWEAKGRPRRHRDAQGGPERPRGTKGSPGKPNQPTGKSVRFYDTIGLKPRICTRTPWGGARDAQ